MTVSGHKLNARTLSEGDASGELTVLSEALSFWGGFDLSTGCVIDQKHPELGTCLTSKILALPSGRGSSSASSVLTESIRSGVGPCGIILLRADPIIALASIVAAELYSKHCPVILVDQSSYSKLTTYTQASIYAVPEQASLTLQ